MTRSVAAWAVLAVTALAPVALPARAAEAKTVAFFEETCGACHGTKGEGTKGLAPPLKGSRFVIDSPPTEIAATITKGRMGGQKRFPDIPGPMPPHSMSDNRLQAVIAYVRDEIQK